MAVGSRWSLCMLAMSQPGHSRRLPFLFASIIIMAPAKSVCCFQPPNISAAFGRLLNDAEGLVARRKVNADVNDQCAKYAVGPDVEYAYAVKEPKVDHALWNSVLRRHVSPGTVDGVTTNVVDYAALATDEDVEKYRKVLAKASLAEMESTPNELLALYINAYNCLCIGHVTRYLKENGKLPSSVTKTRPPSAKKKEIWDVAAGEVGGETLSLNDIEHKVLRSKWAEPRIHASIVCASASCPNLRTEAYFPHRLNEQMDDQARAWVGDATKGVRIDKEQTLSRIFLWFAGDFKASGGPVVWAKQFAEDGVARKLSEKRSLKYFPYNWKLNNK